MFPRIFLALILVSTTLATASAAEVESSPESGWPQFRGPRRDGVSTERGLLAEWPAEGPRVLWSADGLGRGYSSPVIVGSRIYLTGDVEGELRLWAMDREGKRLWEQKHGLAWMQPYPGARATPTYSAGRLYLLNAHGRLGCFEAESGK
ncbi:MAG: alcohol dehydrogenase, partial [Planctomycetia bacterium]|nr:alcohol dehydrogenase [Planctomycetia bacterium]